jgi:hypothetical protein
MQRFLDLYDVTLTGLKTVETQAVFKTFVGRNMTTACLGLRLDRTSS